MRRSVAIAGLAQSILLLFAHDFCASDRTNAAGPKPGSYPARGG